MPIPPVNHYVRTNVVVSPWGKKNDKTWEFAIWECSKQPGSGTHPAPLECAEVPRGEPKSRVGELDVPEEALEFSTSEKDGVGLTQRAVAEMWRVLEETHPQQPLPISLVNLTAFLLSTFLRRFRQN